MISSNRSTKTQDRTTVLIVEDHADTSRLLVRAFTIAGFRTVTAASVDEALRLLRASQRVDAVLADYVLGDGTGTAMLHQAQNEGLLDLAVVPAIICSGYSYVELPPNVVALHKPIPPAALVREVSQMLSEGERVMA